MNFADIRHYARRCRHGLLPLMLAAGVTGCINQPSDYDCPLSEADAVGTHLLQLNILVPASRTTRAHTNAPNEQKPEEGTSAENKIGVDSKDFDVLIFDEAGNQVGNFVPMTTSVEQGDKVSIVSLIGPIETTTGNGKLEKFQAMVLANWKSFNGGSYEGSSGKNLSGIATDNTNLNFTMPNESGEEAWMPALGANESLIPMFGLSGLMNLGDATAVGNGNAITSTTIPMLRALAKVEVIDKTEEVKGGAASKIVSVSLDQSLSTGRYIPNFLDNSIWHSDAADTYVNAVSMPVDYDYDITNLQFVKVEDNKWVAYVPEMYLSSDAAKLTRRPEFSLTVEDNSTYQFPFNNYFNGQPNTNERLMQVLRNHIYRFEINNIIPKGMNVDVTLTVDKWDEPEEQAVWDYFDRVIVEQPDGSDTYLKLAVAGQTPQYDDDPEASSVYKLGGYTIDPEKYSIIMAPGNDDYIEATFKITEPLHATWQASIITIEGVDNAIIITTGAKNEEGRFVEGDNTGIIDGESEITIKIANNNPTTEVNNVGQLRILVMLPDKQTWYEANVCDGDWKAVKNYTITQNSTAI